MFAQWLREVFSSPDWLKVLTIVGRSAVIYLFVVLAMRLLGARPLGRMSAYDFVLVVVIANAVQNALVAGDNSLVGGLVSAITCPPSLTTTRPEAEVMVMGWSGPGIFTGLPLMPLLRSRRKLQMDMGRRRVKARRDFTLGPAALA